MFLQMEMRHAREAEERLRHDLERRAIEIAERARIAPAGLWVPDTPRLPVPGGPLLERGIYVSPFLSRHGHVVLFAVDSRHRSLKTLEIRDDRPEAMVRRVLRGILDQYDPVPQLRAI